MGNLVCPAEFRVGEDAKAMVCSVTEGEDKPLKYPLMFRTCELVVVNKIDLLPHIDFDLDRFLANVDSVNPGVRTALTSARTGEGVEEVAAWLAGGGEGAHRRVTPVARGPDRRAARPPRRSRRGLLRGRGGAHRRGCATAWPSASPRAAGWWPSGLSAQARSDVRHVTVEFVHPVIVGKRALPALGLSREGGSLPGRWTWRCEPGDIAIAFGTSRRWRRRWPRAGRRGALTVGVRGGGRLALPRALRRRDGRPGAGRDALPRALGAGARVLRAPGPARGARGAPAHDSGASSFLYPFLAESETDVDAVLDDVRGSVLLKSAEAEALREQTLRDGGEQLAAAAAALRECFGAGGKLLALGNGGSATDAMDVVADLREPPGGARRRRALDLTEDPAVITAIANDIGTDAIFQRQVIAHGRPGDALLALSTSGNSRNVIEALAEARRRGLVTIAMVGYDGGRVAAEQLADHVVVTRSEHIPRIQEAQATAYHALVELLEEEA